MTFHACVFAQTFTVPSATSFVYGDPAIGREPQGTACYSFSYIPTGFGYVDLYFSSWHNRQSGEFIFQIMPFAAPPTPTPIFQQSFPYPDAIDLNIGFVRNWVTFNYEVVVTYYKHGSGHFMDIYELTSSTSTPLVLISTTQLSNAMQYGRISTDTHDPLSAIVVAWENPGVGIQTITCEGGAWSGITTLWGTKGVTEPDVAFSHVSGTDMVAHFVYKDPSSGTAITSMLTWPLLLSIPSTTTATLSPAIEDINPVPMGDYKLMIDCPDHNSTDDWAYTYTDGKEVFVRLLYSGALSTIHVNNGSLGNASLIAGFYASTPTIHYNKARISVGWYSRYLGGDSHYIGVSMGPNGTGLLNNPDYMRLPNSVFSYSNPFSGIYYSKMSDFQFSICPDYMYATYYTDPGSQGQYQLNHAFHKFWDPVFRAEQEVHDCKQGASPKTLAVSAPKTFPNPFEKSITHKILSEENGFADLRITSVTGENMGSFNHPVRKGDNNIRIDHLDRLNPGTYILETWINGKKKYSQAIIKN
jgi:hypothetical protein